MLSDIRRIGARRLLKLRKALTKTRATATTDRWHEMAIEMIDSELERRRR